MKAAVQVRYGNPDQAYQIQEVPTPTPKTGEVRIQVQAFGLNFADVLARRNLYQDAPKNPAVLGYEVVGTIEMLGPNVHHLQLGQRVLAFTQFGGYAQYITTDARVAIPIPDTLNATAATALAVQYSTAYYAAHIATTLQPADHILIHAAAGGVGTALVQLATLKGCTIYGTCSTSKLKHLQQIGVHHPIDYTTTDFEHAIRQINPKAKLDLIFDSIGGTTFKKGMKLLGGGGRIVTYGVADMSNGSNRSIPRMVRTALGFGFTSPINLLQKSQGIIGVNMLRIANARPDILAHCMHQCVHLASTNQIQPIIGGEYAINDLAKAHQLLESRQSIGKIAVYW